MKTPGDGWFSMDEGGGGAGAQVWVAYPNPFHPHGWNLRVQWTPIRSEHAVEPLFWRPIEQPDPPTASGGTQWEKLRAALKHHETAHGFGTGVHLRHLGDRRQRIDGAGLAR